MDNSRMGGTIASEFTRQLQSWLYRCQNIRWTGQETEKWHLLFFAAWPATRQAGLGQPVGRRAYCARGPMGTNAG